MKKQNKKSGIGQKKSGDIAYYIPGQINKKIDEFRNSINKIVYTDKYKRNVKKYEILSAIVLIGLQHQNEVLDELGLIDISEQELKDGKKEK